MTTAKAVAGSLVLKQTCKTGLLQLTAVDRQICVTLLQTSYVCATEYRRVTDAHPVCATIPKSKNCINRLCLKVRNDYMVFLKQDQQKHRR